MFPWPPPLLLELLVCRPVALSRKLSRALKLLDTATFVHVSLAESTLLLPNIRPHLLAPVPRADGGPDGQDANEGDGHGDGAELMIRESSVSVNLAGSYFPKKEKERKKE